MPMDGADALLRSLRPGDSIFGSGEHTIVGSGQPSTVSVTAPAGVLSQKLRLALAAHNNPVSNGDRPTVAFGAVPFDATEPAHFVLPERVTWAGPRPVRSGLIPGPRTMPPEFASVTPIPSQQQYVDAVRVAMAEINGGRLEKVVLARALDAEAHRRIDVPDLLRHLAEAIPSGYLFGVPLPGPADRYLTGVSPELLVSRRGQLVRANPLAGSVARSPDPVQDEHRRQALLDSAKDLHEHDFVRDGVLSALAPLCVQLHAPRTPTVLATPTMWHLSTPVVGRVRDSSVSALDLALALHPTPAVCGTPTTAARELIRRVEDIDRGYYAGFVGWCDSVGDGEWAVTLRCAEVESRRLRLFAGAGVVAGSKPEDELSETAAKFGTLLNAMSLGAPDSAAQFAR